MSKPSRERIPAHPQSERTRSPKSPVSSSDAVRRPRHLGGRRRRCAALLAGAGAAGLRRRAVWQPLSEPRNTRPFRAVFLLLRTGPQRRGAGGKTPSALLTSAEDETDRAPAPRRPSPRRGLYSARGRVGAHGTLCTWDPAVQDKRLLKTGEGGRRGVSSGGHRG